MTDDSTLPVKNKVKRTVLPEPDGGKAAALLTWSVLGKDGLMRLCHVRNSSFRYAKPKKSSITG